MSALFRTFSWNDRPAGRGFFRTCDPDGGDMGRGWAIAKMLDTPERTYKDMTFPARRAPYWGFLCIEYPNWMAPFFTWLTKLVPAYDVDGERAFGCYDRWPEGMPAYGASGGIVAFAPYGYPGPHSCTYFLIGRRK